MRAEKGSVAGSTLGLSIDVNGKGLASAIVAELAAGGLCTVAQAPQ